MSSTLALIPAPALPLRADLPIVVNELVMDGDQRFGHYNLSYIRISKTNRKRFKLDALNDLAESIKQIGVAQPILIRPVTPTEDSPQHYEIVAGERRYRASVIAGLTVIPAMCRVLSDLEAAKIQILENLQREDPHPLEEAEGYEQLMLKHGYSADELAAELKKSRSYVYGRLKLCALNTEVREMFLDNQEQLSASTALLIARIPVPALQSQALKEILAPQWNREPMSYRAAVAHIAGRYTLDLAEAPFDTKDAKLLAEAGNCKKCPKRTGNQPEIYPDAKNADVCTDPDCFAEKKAAHYQRMIVTANKRGIPVLEGDAAKVIQHAWHRDSELVTINQHLSAFERVAPSTGMGGTVKDHVPAEALPTPVNFVKLHDGSVLAAYNRTEMQIALEKAGACESEEAREARLAKEGADPDTAGKLKKREQEMQEWQAKQRAAQREAKARTQGRVALYRNLRSHIERNGASLNMLRALAKALLLGDNYYSLPEDLLGDLYSFGRSDEEACAYIDQATGPELHLLIMDMVFGECLGVSTYDLDEDENPALVSMKRLAELEGVEATAADIAIAGINVSALHSPADVHEVIEANTEHLAEVCNFIADKAPHHVGNVQAAATALGYVYGKDGWTKAPEADPANDADADADQLAAQLGEEGKQPRSTLKLKSKPAASAPSEGPIVKVKKNRTVVAPAEAFAGTAWPFPTERQPIDNQ